MGRIVRSWCLGLGSAGLLVVALLPWVQSGQRDRNSFDLLGSADRLGLIDGVVQRAAQVGWLVVPAVVGAIVIALAFHRRTVAAVGGLYVALASAAVAALVIRSSLEPTGWPAVALLLGLIVAAVALADLFGAKRFSRVSTEPAVGDVSAP